MKIQADGYLFDIDGTLMDTGGRGCNAFLDTAESVFAIPAHEAGLRFSGATDLGLLQQLSHHFDLAPASPDQLQQFFRIYAKRLREALPKGSCEALTGAGDLLQTLADSGHPTGLVTGNAAETARIKVEACGLSEFFSFGGYGDQDPERAFLVRFAIRMYHSLAKNPNKYGEIQPSEWCLIGDTPNDIQAAVENKVKSVGVTTGSYNREKLSKYNPDIIISYLSDLL